MPPWNELVIYETHIGTFNRKNADEVGTFHDYIKRFDHLRKLGVNALQVMPIAEFAGDLSWGYNPAHPYAIESAYGGPDSFKTFVREAHKNGFAVILDVVYNHFGPAILIYGSLTVGKKMIRAASTFTTTIAVRRHGVTLGPITVAVKFAPTS